MAPSLLAILLALCEGHQGIAWHTPSKVQCIDGVAYVFIKDTFHDSRCVINGKVDVNIGADDLDCLNSNWYK